MIMINISFYTLILPVSFIALWFLVTSFSNIHNWRLSFILTVVTANLYIIFMTENLSFFKLLTQTMVILFWLLPILLLLIIIVKPGGIKQNKRPKFQLKALDWYDWILMSFAILVLLIIGIVAYFAPPNTYDVLRYHLPRVMHWIQNRSIYHYPSGVEFQNTFPPAAELQFLQLIIINQNDQLVNFASWFMLLTLAISAAYLTSLFRINKTGQILSSIFVITLPTAILQASTAKNDLHVAVWTIVSLTLMIASTQKEYTQSTKILPFCFSAIGIGLLTKTNTLLFLFPILVWFSIKFIKQYGVTRALKWCLIAVCIIGLINSGYAIRNIQTFGTIQDPVQSARLMNDRITPKGILTNGLRNLIFHVQFPWHQPRYEFELFLIKVHAKLGMDINDPSFTSDGYFGVKGVTTRESLTGNTLHALISILIIFIYILRWKKNHNHKNIWLLILFSVSGYFLFSAVIKWQVFGGRFFLPLLVILAPLFGLILSKISLPALTTVFAAAILFLSWPWLLSAELRPILSNNYSAYRPSIITTDRQAHLMGTERRYPGLFKLPDFITDTQCDSIGIHGRGTIPEYQVWSILNSPRNDLRLEWIVAGTPSAKYIDPDFDPCLIICYECMDEQTEIRGLMRVFKGNFYDIYSKPLN